MGSSQVLKAIAKGASDAMCPAQVLRLAVWAAKIGSRRVDPQQCLELPVAAGNGCGPVAGTRPATDLLGNHGGPARGICAVTPIGSHHNVKVNLTAASAAITIGGYKVVTENYNGDYLTPVIEAMPGDTVSAPLVNGLTPKPHAGMSHGDPNDNPTNLHYFHGGIVTPNNARPKPAELGNGDNIYVHLKSGVDAEGQPNSFDFEVPIPGENMLDARVLETQGQIAHPVGLNWYHSHLHGISSNQVMGGSRYLLSVGAATAT
jgi:hypothetical protein